MSRRVVAVVDDMFFASKIRAVAEAVGVEISFPRSKEALIEKAREAQLILVDLHNQRFDPIDIAHELRGVPMVAFFSHVETELQRKALAAGFNQVLPRSAFVRDLPRILATDHTDDYPTGAGATTS
jgi:CheY-like chemotaxis protein